MIFKGVIIVAGIVFGILVAVILFSGYLETSQEIDGQNQDEDVPSNPTLQYEVLKQFLNDRGRAIVCEHCVGTYVVEDLLRGVEIDPHPYIPKIQKVLEKDDIVLDYS